MKDIPVTNNTKSAIHVAGSTVLPGETRIFPKHHVPPNLRQPEAQPEPEEPAIDAALKAILEGNVTQVAEALVDLRAEDLDFLEAIESAEDGGKKRKGVLEALANEKLMRASTVELDEFRDSLEGKTEEELLNLVDEVDGDLARQDIIQIALEKLSPGGD